MTRMTSSGPDGGIGGKAGEAQRYPTPSPNDSDTHRKARLSVLVVYRYVFQVKLSDNSYVNVYLKI
jgi:hypothetical protein